MADGRAGHAGDPARRLPDQTRARPDHRRGRETVDCLKANRRIRMRSAAAGSSLARALRMRGSRFRVPASARSLEPPCECDASPHGERARWGSLIGSSGPCAQDRHDGYVDHDLHIVGSQLSVDQTVHHLVFVLDRALTAAGPRCATSGPPRRTDRSGTGGSLASVGVLRRSSTILPLGPAEPRA